MFFPVYLKHDDFFFHAEFEFKLILSFWCDPGQCDDLYVVEIQYMLRGKKIQATRGANLYELV